MGLLRDLKRGARKLADKNLTPEQQKELHRRLRSRAKRTGRKILKQVISRRIGV